IDGGTPTTSGSGPGLLVEVRQYDDPNTLNDVVFSQQLNYPVKFLRMTMPCVADGDLEFRVLANGQHPELIYTAIANDFLTADEVGFFVNDQSNLYDAQATLVHWDLTTEPLSFIPGPSIAYVRDGLFLVLPYSRDKVYYS